MSQPTVEPGNQLSEILNRINALTQQEHEKQVPPEDGIPRLTESYDGDISSQFIEATNVNLPMVEQVVSEFPPEETLPQQPTAEPVPNSRENLSGLTPAQQEKLLLEMEPLIQNAVRQAVQKELLVIKSALEITLAHDMLEVLKKRISSGQL
jgi:hypothetical protein